MSKLAPAAANIRATAAGGLRTGIGRFGNPAPAPVTIIYGGGSSLPAPQPTPENSRHPVCTRTGLNTPYLPTSTPQATPPAKPAAKASTTVKAYVVFNYSEPSSPYETIYFVDHDGTVYTTGERPYSNHFNLRGTGWSKVDALPEWVEFIGNYRRPTTKPAPKAAKRRPTVKWG